MGAMGQPAAASRHVPLAQPSAQTPAARPPFHTHARAYFHAAPRADAVQPSAFSSCVMLYTYVTVSLRFFPQVRASLYPSIVSVVEHDAAAEREMAHSAPFHLLQSSQCSAALSCSPSSARSTRSSRSTAFPFLRLTFFRFCLHLHGEHGRAGFFVLFLPFCPHIAQSSVWSVERCRDAASLLFLARTWWVGGRVLGWVGGCESDCAGAAVRACVDSHART
jgi:hypothetical protein